MYNFQFFNHNFNHKFAPISSESINLATLTNSNLASSCDIPLIEFHASHLAYSFKSPGLSVLTSPTLAYDIYLYKASLL